MKKKTKRARKEPLHLLRNRCDSLWRDAVLSDGGEISSSTGTTTPAKCRICLKAPATQAHHIFHKGANNSFRYHRVNGLPACTGCHLREKFNPTAVVMRAIEYHGSALQQLWVSVKRNGKPKTWTRAELEAVEMEMKRVVTN